jgi:transcription initiation factor TFIIB
MEAFEDPTTSVCPECRGRIIQDFDSGEVVCSGCGLVISSKTVCMEPEWRVFDKTQYETRPRADLTPVNRGPYTIIGPVYRDSKGGRIKEESRLRMLRLKRRQVGLTKDSVETSMGHAVDEIERLSEGLHTPQPVREEAEAIYRRALRRGLTRGRSMPAVSAASVYAALRIHRLSTSLDEVSLLSPVDVKEVSYCYRLLIRGLGLRVPVQRAQTNIPRIASRIEVGLEVQRKALELLDEAERRRVTVGKDPLGLAATALYLSCSLNGEKRSQKEVAEAAGVTEVTIRNRCKELKRIMGAETPTSRTAQHRRDVAKIKF